MQVGSKNLGTGDDMSSGWPVHKRQGVAGESNQPKAEAQDKKHPTKPAQQEDKAKQPCWWLGTVARATQPPNISPKPFDNEA